MTHIQNPNWYEILDMPKQVNVLGVDYEIHIVPRDLSEMIECFEEAAGACSVYTPIIEIYCDDFEEQVFELEEYEQKARAHHTLRHEIIHALFIQSGLDYTYGGDETLVDFLAVQIPKIKKHM